MQIPKPDLNDGLFAAGGLLATVGLLMLSPWAFLAAIGLVLVLVALLRR